MKNLSKFRELTKQILFSTKHVIINIENDPVMDDIILRFPSLAGAIFKELDNESLAKCKKVSPFWSDFINHQRFLWIRKIQKCRRSKEIFNIQWKEAFKNVPIEIIKELSDAVKKNWDLAHGLKKQSKMRDTRMWTFLHILAEQGNFEMCQFIIKKIQNKNPKALDGQTPLHLSSKKGFLKVNIAFL